MLAKAKVPTTQDVTAGIVAALDAVIGAGRVDPSRITHAMLGTTHATNAVLRTERPVLREVGAGHRAACHRAEDVLADVTLPTQLIGDSPDQEVGGGRH